MRVEGGGAQQTRLTQKVRLAVVLHVQQPQHHASAGDAAHAEEGHGGQLHFEGHVEVPHDRDRQQG